MTRKSNKRDTLLSNHAAGAIQDSLVRLFQTTGLEHFALVLDEELDTLRYKL